MHAVRAFRKLYPADFITIIHTRTQLISDGRSYGAAVMCGNIIKKYIIARKSIGYNIYF